MWWMTLAFAQSEAMDLGHALVEHAPERATGSAGATRALEWVEARLVERGWTPVWWAGRGVYACKPGKRDDTVLFFAHVDAVNNAGVGANDNAIAVGALLELARRLDGAERTVCLAFPDGEEVGLVGSRALKDSLELFPQQVVALDLIGRGELTHNGLGPGWTSRDAQRLLDVAPAEVPWVYRALSHGLPEFERSDHGPWVGDAVTSHLMARGEHGVYWPYHTAEDTSDKLEPPTVRAAVDRLEAMARLPPVTLGSGEPWFVLPWTHTVIPGWATWVSMVGAVFLGFPLFGSARERTAWIAVPAGLAAGAVGVWLAGQRFFGADLAWTPVLAGWSWAGAAVLAAGGRAGLFWVRLVGAACLLAGFGLVAVGLPLLALPVFVSWAGVGIAAGSRRWERAGLPLWAVGLVLASWPGAYLIRPDAIRELVFHRMVPADPSFWAVAFCALAASPVAVLSLVVPRSRRIAGALFVVGLLAVLASWILPERTGVRDVPEWLEVQRFTPLPRGGDAIP